jgi:hypothetical protein
VTSRILRPLGAALAVFLICVTAGTAGAAPGFNRASLSTTVQTSAARMLGALSAKSGGGDTQWYAKGLWHFNEEGDCWFCGVGPATLAAVLWKTQGQQNNDLFQKAVDTYNTALASHTNPDGSFGDETAPDTQFFGVELGTTYLLLGYKLDAPTRYRWRAAITHAADYLIHHKDITWETNGNVNLGQTEFEWMAWAITGQPRFKAAYETAYQYTVAPPQSDWAGYGLRMTKGTADSSDTSAAGYLAENGGQGPGFDPEYSMLQLSIASRSFLLTGDPRFERLTSMLWNQLSTLTDKGTWQLDARNGTRKSHVEPLTTSGLAVLATAGGRSDIGPLLKAQLQRGMLQTLLTNATQNWGTAGYYRSYGNELGTAVLALAGQKAPAGSAGAGAVQAADTQARPNAITQTTATVSARGVKVSWTPGAGVPSGSHVRLVVDGKTARVATGRQVMMHLGAGLHLISAVPVGSKVSVPAAVVTVPLGWAAR